MDKTEYASDLRFAARILKKRWARKFDEAGGDENECAAVNIREIAKRLNKYAKKQKERKR